MVLGAISSRFLWEIEDWNCNSQSSLSLWCDCRYCSCICLSLIDWHWVKSNQHTQRISQKPKCLLLNLCISALETDHKPLVPLLGKKSLDSLPPQELRFHLRLMRFECTITHVPGKELYTPDTLSWAPVDNQLGSKLDLRKLWSCNK